LNPFFLFLLEYIYIYNLETQSPIVHHLSYPYLQTTYALSKRKKRKEERHNTTIKNNTLPTKQKRNPPPPPPPPQKEKRKGDPRHPKPH
jgi:hypothetical protein